MKSKNTLDLQKLCCIQDELRSSFDLIRSGFGELQEIDMANTFYSLPHQLLASGFERLMKCYILLAYVGKHGNYPSTAFLTSIGHNLECLIELICHDYYGGPAPIVQRELAFITTDAILRRCIKILSLFGMKGRYYNLDVVTGGATTMVSDPTEEWKDLESTVEDPRPYIRNPEAMHHDYFPRVHSHLIANMERLVRAIALQFTLGEHASDGSLLRQLSGMCNDFRNLRDGQLGTIDYRRSVRVLQQEQENWTKRSDAEIVSGEWPTRSITREDYGGDWPFRADRVIIECRDGTFCIVYVNGYAYSLNGAARGRFKFPDVHAAGTAVIGKSVGPFIDAALRLPTFT